jgi:hypothetical protein
MSVQRYVQGSGPVQIVIIAGTDDLYTTKDMISRGVRGSVGYIYCLVFLHVPPVEVLFYYTLSI